MREMEGLAWWQERFRTKVKFHELYETFMLLSDPTRRAEYDEFLELNTLAPAQSKAKPGKVFRVPFLPRFNFKNNPPKTPWMFFFFTRQGEGGGGWVGLEPGGGGRSTGKIWKFLQMTVPVLGWVRLNPRGLKKSPIPHCHPTRIPPNLS